MPHRCGCCSFGSVGETLSCGPFSRDFSLRQLLSVASFVVFFALFYVLPSAVRSVRAMSLHHHLHTQASCSWRAIHPNERRAVLVGVCALGSVQEVSSLPSLDYKCIGSSNAKIENSYWYFPSCTQHDVKATKGRREMFREDERSRVQSPEVQKHGNRRHFRISQYEYTCGIAGRYSLSSALYSHL